MPVNIFIAESIVPKLEENNRKLIGLRADRSGKTSSAAGKQFSDDKDKLSLFAFPFSFEAVSHYVGLTELDLPW